MLRRWKETSIRRITYDNGLSLFTTIGSFNGAPGIGAGEPL
jgi:hypothetical protein